MDVAFTKDISHEISEQMSIISDLKPKLREFFEQKEYGRDLLVLYICVICLSPNFEKLFKGRRPKYTTQGRVYIHHGVQIIGQSMTLDYDLKLDFAKYIDVEDIRPLFAKDVLNSLEVIKTIKKIKEFNYDGFRHDFEAFFWNIGWLG